MSVAQRTSLALGAAAALALLAGCSRDLPTKPRSKPAFDASVAPADAVIPSGERDFGNVAIEPGFDAVTGNVIYMLTPKNAPFPTHANANAVAPLYIVVYPEGSPVHPLNCEGVPGNCPDHDRTMANIAIGLEPGVYGSNPSDVPGHDHVFAAPGPDGDFNIAWDIHVVAFTSVNAAQTRLTTEAAIHAALSDGSAVEMDLHTAFHCSVVSAATYALGTPVGS